MGAKAEARRRSPASVCWKSAQRSAATARTATTVKRSCGENRRWCPPTTYPRIENAGGKERGVPPQIMPASACSRMSRPSVTITALSGGPPSTGRISTRSTIAPITKPQTRATTNPSQYEPLEAMTLDAMNVVTMNIPPWAKFTIRVARQIITSERATAA